MSSIEPGKKLLRGNRFSAHMIMEDGVGRVIVASHAESDV
jgi:hypothetical protein